MNKEHLMKLIKEYDAKFLDLRFTDLRGQEQHVTIPVGAADENFIEFGKTIDGSSFKGWKKIHQSDLSVVPDLNCIHFDPFYQENTLFIRCNIVDPETENGYTRDPRTIAQKAEHYLKETGIADAALFGPEPEFFIFDDVQWENSMSGCFYKIDSEEAQWNSGKPLAGGNIGHRPKIKGGYFPVPPVDSSQDIRSSICNILNDLGIEVEAHHHEVATANQCEVATKYNSLTNKADEMQILKYVVRNVAHNYGKTATFMPKPIVGDNGSGMHCHQSLAKNGENLFAGDGYAGLSELAIYYIGGIIRHARALNAFTNPATNSYKRLIPGYEAPVLLSYSSRNRSAAIRIPYVTSEKGRRIEVRFPDSVCNPYLAFSAMMMAGLDGIKNKIHPGNALDKDLYELPGNELIDIPTVANSLDDAINHLERDHEFLLQGNVFSKDFIESYADIKRREIAQLKSLVHPFEFELYYSD